MHACTLDKLAACILHQKEIQYSILNFREIICDWWEGLECGQNSNYAVPFGVIGKFKKVGLNEHKRLEGLPL